MSTICVEQLSFSYRRFQVLQRVNFSIGKGITGLLGQNGAGKTTLLRLIVGELKPDEGRISFGVKRSELSIGYLPQKFELLTNATVLRNVSYAAWAQGANASSCEQLAMQALGQVGLAENAQQRVRLLSGGMRQRLGIACALANNPSVLVLDEPTVGLDPLQRVQMRKLLEELAQNICVLTSTHLIDDLVATAANVMVLNKGKMVFQGKTSQLANLGLAEMAAGITEYEAGYMALLRKDQS